MRIENTSKNPITLSCLPEEKTLNNVTVLASLDGQYVPVEHKRTVNKVVNVINIPGKGPGPDGKRQNGAVEMTKKVFDTIDPVGLECFAAVLIISGK
jgi:hypothetical protein